MELHKWRGLLDCGDHSCLFTDNRSGQRTNGGCRCVPPGPQSNRLKLVINMLMDNEKRLSDDYAALEAERDRLRGFVKKLVDVKSEPDKLLCLLEREDRLALEE